MAPEDGGRKQRLTLMSTERWAFSPETYAVTARRDEWSNALARLSMESESTATEEVAGALTVRRFAGSFTVAHLAAPPQILLAVPGQTAAMGWLATPLEGDVHLAGGNRPSKLLTDDVVFGDVPVLTPLVIRAHSRLLMVGFSTARPCGRACSMRSPPVTYDCLRMQLEHACYLASCGRYRRPWRTCRRRWRGRSRRASSIFWHKC
jgi:hypothetical protein